MYKPKLSVPEQISHLEEKGVGFSIVSKEQALDYLSRNNNFFKLTAYRKNYVKNRDGRYVNLEFAFLRDLAILDMRIRKCLLDMCLDIEHNTRMRIVKSIEESSEDGYTVVDDYKNKNASKVCDCYKRAEDSPYCHDIISKYRDSMPIWAFVEIQQFGGLCELFRFIAERFGDSQMKNEYYMLQEIRRIRNACAHSNCVLNDLKSSPIITYKPNSEVVHALASIGVSSAVRERKLSNDRIRQIVTLLYYYKQYINSRGLKKYQGAQLRNHLVERPQLNEAYYQKAEQILTFFKFLKLLVDKWFPESYNTSIEKKS